MSPDAQVDAVRLSGLRQLQGQLLAALNLAERLEEFLLAAQIALALDTVTAVLGDDLPEPR